MSSSSSSEYSSDEDERLLLIINRGQQVRPKNKNYVSETVPIYSDDLFREHFRLSRYLFNEIVARFENSQHYAPDAYGGNGKLSAEHQMLTFLWFCGHQTASFRDVADRFDITISSLHRIINRLTTFFSSLAGLVIQWPNEDEKQAIEAVYRERGFPGVVGIIDGTHIKIDKPTEDPDSYLNRKHFFSLQVQVVCDHQRRIRDVFIGYPGSVHDSRVFRVSPLSTALPAKCGENRYILGDSGYPCTRHLLIPFRDRGQLTAAQRNFNNSLSCHRYIIEHCFGLLKQKFRQLYHVKLRNSRRICHFIRACCVLHNLTIDDTCNFEDEIAQEIEGADARNDAEGYGDDRDGVELRNYIASILPHC